MAFLFVKHLSASNGGTWAVAGGVGNWVCWGHEIKLGAKIMLKEFVNKEKTAVFLKTVTPPSLLVFLGLVAIALFPYGWLAEESPLFARLLTWLFRTDAAHVVGHAFIFALLGTAVLHLHPPLRKNPRLYFTIILLMGLAQESFQLLSFKHRWFGLGELMDLGVDLVSAAAVYWIYREK